MKNDVYDCEYVNKTVKNQLRKASNRHEIGITFVSQACLKK
jgi:hypothetical protein